MQTLKIFASAAWHCVERRRDGDRERNRRGGIKHEGASSADITGAKTCPDKINVSLTRSFWDLISKKNIFQQRNRSKFKGLSSDFSLQNAVKLKDMIF